MSTGILKLRIQLTEPLAHSVFAVQAFAANYWVKKGVPPSSLNIGLALYGRTFTLVDSAHSAVGSAVSGAGRAGRFTAEPGYMAYYEVGETWLTLGYMEYYELGET